MATFCQHVGSLTATDISFSGQGDGWTHVIEDGMVLYARQASPKNVEEFEILEVGFRRAGRLPDNERKSC